MDSFASRRSDRLAGAMLALLLQLGFLALLIASRPLLAPPEELVRELTLILPRLRERPLPAAPAPRQEYSPRPLQAPLPQIALPPNPNAPAAAKPDLSRLGQSIFGCAPENYSSLTPEQRALCPRPGEGVAVQEAPDLMGSRSHVKDEARWEAELAHKKSPTWLPCTGAANMPSGASVGFSPLCLIAMASEGTLTDPHEWPTYRVEQLAPEDFYKIEQAYDAWNKTHGGQ